MSGMDDFCSQCVERPEEGPCPLHGSEVPSQAEVGALLSATFHAVGTHALSGHTSELERRLRDALGRILLDRLSDRDGVWVDRLSTLCDDEWLRRRDRAMELPGAKGHRWERRASSAWEQAANAVRHVLNELADYEDQFGNRHAAYMKWLKAGRDEGQAQR